MSRTEGSGTELDDLLSDRTPLPGHEGAEDERGRGPARSRLETWLRGGDGARGRGAESGELAGSSTARPVDLDLREPGGAADANAPAEGELRSLPVEDIEPNAYQPRRRFDEESLSSLAESIRVLGVLQPVLVRAVGRDRYELVAGERRWRAAKRAGMRMIPALVRETSDQGALEQAIVENLHRRDLNPVEEAAAYRELVEDFGLSQEQVAERVGKSRPAVANALRLLHLPAGVQRLLVEGRLTAGHGRALVALEGDEAKLALARRIVDEELSVRRTEEAVRAWLEDDRSSSQAPSGVGSGGGRSTGALEIEAVLEAYLETRVEVQERGRGGRLVIRFADGEDLDRLAGLIGGDASDDPDDA